MPSRFARIVAIAAEEPAESNVLLKVCPRCRTTSSRFDTHCQRCAKKAKRIEQIIKVQELDQKRLGGEALSKEEQEFLKRHQKLLDEDVTQEDIDFLEQAPFELPEPLVVVRPSFRNLLQFFMDRMQAEGRKVTTTHAAAKLLKFDEGGFVNKKDFVDFATDHGVRPLMSADWEQFYAAWRTEDILKLLHERWAERSAKTTIEAEPGKVMSSLEASTALGMGGTKTFMDFAAASGIKPAHAFGERSEQIVWHAEDVEALRRLWEIETDILQLEEAEERIARGLTEVQKPPMKYPQMLKMRELDKEMAAIKASLAKARQQREHEQIKTKELAAKREQTRTEEKKASDSRLAQILSFAVGPDVTDRKVLLDRIYKTIEKATHMITAEKDLMELLDEPTRQQAMEGLLSFDQIIDHMMDRLRYPSFDEEIEPGQN